MPSPSFLLNTLKKRPSPDETLAILSELSRARLTPRELLAYHEALLFGKAYPRSPLMRVFCDQELDRFVHRVHALGKHALAELDQSGIAGTRIYYPYDYPMATWLVERLGNDAEIDWDAYGDRTDDPLSSHMSQLMEVSEGDAVDSEDLSVQDLISAARGSRTALSWLLERFGAAFPDSPTRQQIFDPMQISFALTLNPPGPSRSILDDGQPRKLFIWDPQTARSGFDLVYEARRPLHIPAPVSTAQARRFLDLVYGSLLTRTRELYPATHCNLAEVYDIPLERGIRVIWFFNKPAYRLPLEAGWGCLLLKNNVPIGYGAGGMVAGQSEISINIFDTFRGGEAGWLYAQYARICYQWCRAPWLVTRKWQLGGEGNDEGIESGSFWFYDKLGFRSTDPGLRKLADRGRRKIASKKGYRCPPRILHKLAEADVVFSLDGRPATEYREFPLARAGLAATRVITEQFNGDRIHLETRVLSNMKRQFGVSYSGWTKAEKSRFAQMSLFVLAIPRIERWPKSDLRSLFALCRAKGSSCETDYIRLFRENSRFWSALSKI